VKSSRLKLNPGSRQFSSLSKPVFVQGVIQVEPHDVPIQMMVYIISKKSTMDKFLYGPKRDVVVRRRAIHQCLDPIEHIEMFAGDVLDDCVSKSWQSKWGPR
jgi:hypothetical protein